MQKVSFEVRDLTQGVLGFPGLPKPQFLVASWKFQSWGIWPPLAGEKEANVERFVWVKILYKIKFLWLNFLKWLTDFEDKSDMIFRLVAIGTWRHEYELHSICWPISVGLNCGACSAESHLKIIHIEWRLNKNGKCLEGCRDVGALSKVMPAIM